MSPLVNAPKTRLPRYRRASTPPPMQLTARDVRILEAVCDMRFLSREQVQQLYFSPSTASYCKRRLALLYHNAFLARGLKNTWPRRWASARSRFHHRLSRVTGMPITSPCLV